MKKILFFIACAVLAAAYAVAVPSATVKSLTGLKQVRIVCDVHVGSPKLLLLRMNLLDKTVRQLAAAGLKPVVVVAFRGKASLFITKGDGYVDEDEKGAKREMKSWIKRFKQAGYTIEQCAIAAELLDIDLKDFLPQVEIVENGYVSLIGYQQQGYAFLPLD